MRTAKELRDRHTAFLADRWREQEQCLQEVIDIMRQKMAERAEEYFRSPTNSLPFIGHFFQLSEDVRPSFRQLSLGIIDRAYLLLKNEWEIEHNYKSQLIDPRSLGGKILFTIHLSF